jgi:hypothetical protein
LNRAGFHHWSSCRGARPGAKARGATVEWAHAFGCTGHQSNRLMLFDVFLADPAYSSKQSNSEAFASMLCAASRRALVSGILNGRARPWWGDKKFDGPFNFRTNRRSACGGYCQTMLWSGFKFTLNARRYKAQ